jgi:hypothetical protein
MIDVKEYILLHLYIRMNTKFLNQLKHPKKGIKVE